jgi:hypothetical protein
MTALTWYLNQSASATASTADQLLENASTGGSLSNKNTNLVSGTTGWITLYAQGNATGQTGAGSQPALADNGWIDDAVTLVGNHLNAGTYSVSLGFETTTTGTFIADFHFRFYQRSSGGTRTLIGEAIASSQTIISTSYTVLTPSVSASASNTFVSGDKAGCDVTINILTNTTTGNLRMQASSSATLGNTSAQIVTPGYSSVTTSTRTIPTSAVLQSTLTRTIPTSAVLQSTLSRTIPTSAVLQSTLSRTIPTSAVLSGTRRVIPTSAVLMSTLSRNIPTSGVFQSTLARVIPTSAVLYTPAVFYASNVAQTISSLILSDQMSMQIGGTETSFTVTAPSSGANSYVELVSQGGTPTATATLPAPTGLGWSINLAGNTILAGPWFSTFTLAKSGSSMSGASLITRWYRRTMDGTHYPIGIATLSSQTFSTSKTSYTTPTVTVNFPWQFVQNDVLYVDAFVTNGSTAWSSDVFTIYVSNSASMGVTNDGTTTAPTMISTPAGLSCMIGASAFINGTTSPIKNESFTLANAADQRSVLSLTVEDASSNLSYVDNMPVILSDHDQGKLYDGYLASDQKTKVAVDPTDLRREHKLTFADHHRDYDKESNGIQGANTNGTNYSNWSAGDIACDFIDKVQVDNGIWGEYAIEADYSQSAFSQGTLTGVTATNTVSPFTYAPNVSQPPVTTNTGSLELTRAGTQFTLAESVTSDFSSGTLTNMVASNNELKPATQSAIKVTAIYSPVIGETNVAATESGGTQTNTEFILNLMHARIWSGSMTVGTNDTLNYDIWISSTSPAFLAGIEIIFSDGSYLTSHNGTLDSGSDLGLFDQNGVSVEKLQDFSNYAKDCWYTRNITLTGLNGKTISTVDVYLTGSSAGTYTVYVKNVYLGSQSGSPFFSTTATSIEDSSVVYTTGGYISSTVNRSVVAVYNPLVSYRVSPAHSISGVGLVQNSSITWAASLPTTGAAAIVYPPGTSTTSSSSSGTSPAMVLMISYDGNTWLQCTNSQALPGLPSGANVSGLSLYLREQFACGSDPSAIPALLNVQITIYSAANQTVSDIVTAYGTSTQWNTGTQVLTNPNSNGNLTLGGSANPLTQNWSSMPSQTFLAGPNNASTDGLSGGAYTMTPAVNSGGTWCQSRFDFAGYFQNGTIECDLKMSSLSSTPQTGIEYRQTGWGNANNNFAYYVFLRSDNAIEFGYGSNNFQNTTGTYNSVTVVSVGTISAGTFYHLKIVVNNNRHTIYFNHNSSPSIDVLDNTYTAAGQIGFRAYTPSSSATFTASIDNFSMITTTAGTWTSPSISLTSLGTCGYNQVAWTDLSGTGQPESTTTVLASVDGSSTWQICTNGAEIPQLPRGTSTSGMSLVFQLILSSTTPPVTTPIIMGLYARICGPYGTVTGSRISPAINLTPVGYVASSNAAYHANIPTSTSATMATSQDASRWTTVANSGAGATLGYWTNQPAATQDLFSSVTSGNYTSTSKSGGSVATATYDTTNSRITLAGGSSALYLNNAINCADVDLLVDMDESDNGGLVWHYIDGNNYYELGVCDASSSSGNANQLRLYKVSSGTRTLLGSASSIVFSRTTLHRIRVKMKSGLINIYWDGSCKQSYLDTSPLGSGQIGLRNDGGTSRYYQLWALPLGTNLSGQVLYLKTTLTTSDPSQMPQVFTQLCCVRGPSIGTGATIEHLHPPSLPFAAYYSSEVDVITQASGDWYWLVNEWRQFRMQARQARPGAFPLQGLADPAGNGYSGVLLYQPPLGFPGVSVTNSADPLRNIQVVTNVSGLVSPPPVVLVADGSTTSWTLGYPVYSAPVILVNGQAATIGISGIDSGQQFYWQPGSTSLTYDSSLPKLPNGTIINVTYTGQSTVNTVVTNAAAIAAQAAIELNSGRIAEIESALTYSTDGAIINNGMSSTQATTFAQGLLNRFGNNNPSEAIGTTMYAGLQPGTIIPVFIPALDLWNTQLPINRVTTTAFLGPNGAVYLYSVDASNGANVTSWQRVWF